MSDFINLLAKREFDYEIINFVFKVNKKNENIKVKVKQIPNVDFFQARMGAIENPQKNNENIKKINISFIFACCEIFENEGFRKFENWAEAEKFWKFLTDAESSKILNLINKLNVGNFDNFLG